jgi:transcriptional regulator with XRE-family HTH domain
MGLILTVRAWRITRGWTQTELAERSGVPQPRISRLERTLDQGGQKGVYLDDLDRLAKALRVPPARLITSARDGNGRKGRNSRTRKASRRG